MLNKKNIKYETDADDHLKNIFYYYYYFYLKTKKKKKKY